MNLSCLTPGCTTAAWQRGLCPACLQRLRVAIRQGALTEAEAIAKKMMAPRKASAYGRLPLRYYGKR